MGDKRRFIDDNFYEYTMGCPQCKKKMKQKTIAHVNLWNCEDCNIEVIKR